MPPSTHAPMPFSAQYTSLYIGASVTAAIISFEPFGLVRSNATVQQKSGLPCMKFIVPSSGSIIQRWLSSSPFTMPVSSVKKPYLGRALFNSSINICTAFKSAAVTKSLVPFLETCKFSNSPKSRTKPLVALRTAFSITVIVGEYRVIIWYIDWG